MGCWPIAGMTSLDVNKRDSLRTLREAIDSGINFFDTAFCYGREGESERLISQALLQGASAVDRSTVVIATKGGIHWDASGGRAFDASPTTLRRECEESLRRLNTDYIDLLYLHAPDPATPVTDSAGALLSLMESGLARTIGVSNFSLEQLQAFHAVCPITAVQPPYNLLQRQIEQDIIPWCLANEVSVVSYWPLLKGLLAGKLSRDHQFREGDGRPKYPMFQGSEWQKNHDFIDELRDIAASLGKTVAQVVVNWTIQQPGITSVLCGAKRPEQIEETAGAMGWQMDDDALLRIDTALKRRGTPVSIAAV